MQQRPDKVYKLDPTATPEGRTSSSGPTAGPRPPVLRHRPTAGDGSSNGNGPIALKIVIVCLTLVALFAVLRACRQIVEPTPPQQDESRGDGVGATNSVRDGGPVGVSPVKPSTGAATNAPAASAGSAEEPRPSPPGPAGGSMEEPSGKPGPPGGPETGSGVPTISQEVRDAARSAKPPSGLATRPSDSGITIFEALLRESLWEAQTLFTLADPYLSAADRTEAVQMLSLIGQTEGRTKYLEPDITASAQLSAELTCKLVGGLLPDRAAAKKARHLVPSEYAGINTGYPALLGDYAESQVQAWCLLLRASGNAGVSHAQRIEAELSSLPQGPSIQRSEAALNLAISTLARVGLTIKQWNASRPVLDQIEARKEQELRSARGVFARHLVLMRAKTATLRHVATGDSP